MTRTGEQTGGSSECAGQGGCYKRKYSGLGYDGAIGMDARCSVPGRGSGSAQRTAVAAGPLGLVG